MSYENNLCPCGGNKPTDTFLCDPCNTALADRKEMETMNNPKIDVGLRRNAAIILVTLSRQLGRERSRARQLSNNLIRTH